MLMSKRWKRDDLQRRRRFMWTAMQRRVKRVDKGSGRSGTEAGGGKMVESGVRLLGVNR